MTTRALEDGALGGCQATPRSPARRKPQAAPPPPPPPPPPPAAEELPWGDLSLNKCLVLASVVALLGGAFQLCRDSVSWEASVPAPVAEPWVPPSSAPKEPAALPQPKPGARAQPSGRPEPQRQAERAEAPRSREAAEKDQGKPAGDAAAEAEPRTQRGPRERRGQERPREERAPKEKRPRKEKQRWEEKPQKEQRREPGEAPLRRREAQEGGQGPWARVSADPKHRKRQAWASSRLSEEEDRPPGRPKRRPGKGRD
ncbi:PREDICTED: junctional sarcoplasmic reticulum protein 1 [Condylura cristata]|uniref:junctional sarcoplasmic reticulum protein 1 n=1 Tax=Condylura cristata TaxID=143302 RepID=UPI00064290FF|nr:PREDICTED: junctional sarcoplasmic reticulum protein 1 [Condylura cristata]